MLGRMAGTALNLGEGLFKGMGPQEIATRLAPDAIFGVVEGTMTPGDLTDKIIAGSGAAIGGATGGLALAKLGGPGAGVLLDMAGSYGGDMLGRAASDQILRGKDKLTGGKGQTPYEKLSDQQMAELLKQGKMQALVEMGLVPPYDPSTGMGSN